MRGKLHDQYVIMQYLSDALAIAAGLLISFWLKFHSGFDSTAIVATDYLQHFWWALGCWMLSLYLNGCIEAHPQVITFNRARKVLYASGLALLLIVVRNYFLKEYDVSRILYPLSFLLVSLFIIINRFALQWLIRRFLSRPDNLTRVIIVGLTPVGLKLAARFKSHPELGFNLVGFISLTDYRPGKTVGGIPVLGGKDDLRRAIRDNQAGEVFVAQADIPNDLFFQMFIDSEKEYARISFIPSLIEMMRSPIHYNEVAGVPTYSIRETPLQGVNSTIKRVIDITCSFFGLLFLMPLFCLIAVAVKRSSPGPVLYKQNRLGLDGKGFKIYKFRTMKVNAEAAGEPVWGNQEDSRATDIGLFLRKWNLDELPQLWNVLRGDMSLVGPRPERPWFADRFRELFPRYMSRHAVKTGMTGWAQVHGLRGDTSIQQRLRYDLYYLENWSIWLDLKILIMTFTMSSRQKRKLRSLRDQSMRSFSLASETFSRRDEKEISEDSLHKEQSAG